jgi:hypothetical protein
MALELRNLSYSLFAWPRVLSLSLLLAQSGHVDVVNQCPLLGVKRTSRLESIMSTFDPKRTSPPQSDSL